MPLAGEDLAGGPNGVGSVAISATGRWVAAVIADQRILVYDRDTGRIDPVPYANLALYSRPRRLLKLGFTSDEASLCFETWDGAHFQLWAYSISREVLRGLVVLDRILGPRGADVTVSPPDLGA